MKIAVLADIHANDIALDAVLKDCALMEVEHYFILGDIIGYYYSPKYVLERLMSLDKIEIIQGNHERMLALALTDPKSRQTIKKKYGQAIEVAIKQLTDKQKKFLTELPEKKVVHINHVNFLLCHGSPFDDDQYIYPNSNPKLLEKCAIDNADFVLMGHTHYPFSCYRNNSIIANAGSVGQPRDIGNLASYLIIDTSNNTLVFRRIAFDYERAAKKAASMDPNLPYLQKFFFRNVGEVKK